MPARFQTFDVRSLGKLTRILRDTETGTDYPFSVDLTGAADLSVAAALIAGGGPNGAILYGMPSVVVDDTTERQSEPVDVEPNADALARERALAAQG